MRVIEGVTGSVHDKMLAVDANVLREDGLMLRTCSHGVRHPVGTVHDEIAAKVMRDAIERHEKESLCCEANCCAAWREQSHE